VLVSDGLCGSTCAVFSSFVQLNKLGKTLVLGGWPSLAQTAPRMQFFAFPGGEVDTISYIREQAARYDGFPMESPLLPAALPNGASFRFAIRELYPHNTDMQAAKVAPGGAAPIEFVHVSANFHEHYTSNFTDTAAIYAQAQRAFDTCVPGIADPVCHAANTWHGSGIRPCVGGVRDMGSCVLALCDAGYTLDATAFPPVCSACAAGTYRDLSMSACVSCSNLQRAVSGLSNVECTYAGTGATNATCAFACTSTITANDGDNDDKAKKTAVIVTIVVAIIACLLTAIVVYCMMRRQQRASAGGGAAALALANSNNNAAATYATLDNSEDA
jgi:hypothetical protein